ncbi:Zinc finger MYM-type protein 1 [Nymphon striatum]|nr:Zinc finger MYM-type protein 1 [Nymphon striatum]
MLLPTNHCSQTSSTSNSRASFELKNGFNKWRKPEKLKSHENNPSHRITFTTWMEAERRLVDGTGIDAIFLVSQNLALRGHEEHLNAENYKNVGNFLALIKLVAQFDPLLAKHVPHAEQNPGSVSYLSPEIQNEFIHILASTVKSKLLSDIRKNKYYAILLDSTPDLGHREQLSQVIRFVDVDFQTKKVAIKESFLGYIEIHSKDAASLEKVIVDRLKSDEIPLANCPAQCYDNAAVMTGHISGLQKRICDRNHRALFVNCDNHSLNVAGVHSAKQDPVVLKRALPITVKRESETRWSARSEAVKAIHEGLDELVRLLEKLSEDSTMTPETRSGAQQLQACVLNFNFIVLLQFWNAVLGKIDRVQKRLQDPTMNFKEAATDIESLEQEFVTLRDGLSQAAVKKAKTKCSIWGIEVNRRIRRLKRMPGELARDAGLSSEEEIVRVMKNVFDRLQHEMSTRFSRLKDLNNKFGFLLDVKTLLSDTDEDAMRRNCADFANFYDTDIDGNELFIKIGDCRMLLSNRTEALPETPLDLLGFIVFYGDDVFPNLRISLQILLTIAVSIASCERSFSKLKLILSYLRASMGQDRLSDLALLSVERETLESTNFNDVIDQFAAVKSRKINLL